MPRVSPFFDLRVPRASVEKPLPSLMMAVQAMQSRSTYRAVLLTPVRRAVKLGTASIVRVKSLRLRALPRCARQPGEMMVVRASHTRLAGVVIPAVFPPPQVEAGM